MGIVVTLTIGTVSSSISYIFAADDDDDEKEELEELEEQDEKQHELEAKEWTKNQNNIQQTEQQNIIPEASAQQPKPIVGSPAPDQQELVKQLEAEKQKLIQELEQRKQQQQIQEQILNQNEMKLILGEVTIPIDANTHLNLDLPKSKIVVEPAATAAATVTPTTGNK